MLVSLTLTKSNTIPDLHLSQQNDDDDDDDDALLLRRAHGSFPTVTFVLSV